METHIAHLALAATTCWLCLPVVRPRGRHLAEDNHLRLLARHHRLTRLALALTVATIMAVVATPSGVNPDMQDLRRATMSCGTRESPYDPPTCYALQPGGQWVVEEQRSDGTRMVVATVTHPAFKPGR